MSQGEITDITIIGTGPVGLFGVFYAGMRGMKTKAVEALTQVGGQLAALYPEKHIYDVAGFPRVQARELVARLKEQADLANPACTYVLGQQVEKLTLLKDGAIELETHTGEKHLTRAVVITVGAGAFEPNRVPLESARCLEGRGVWYTVHDLKWYAGKRVLVVGGGDSAVDYALMLEPTAEQVTLIHRRETFRAHEESLRKLAQSNVEVRVCYELRDVQGDGSVTGAVICSNQSGDATSLSLDAVLLGTGFKASLGRMVEWGLEIEGKRQIKVNSKGETNLPGVYAAGDVCAYPGKIRLIATGFGEVATAVNNAKAFINPGAAAFPGHSSEVKK